MSNPILSRLGTIVGAVLASRCYLCGGAGGADLLCADCAGLLPRFEARQACPVCALPGSGAVLCGQCLLRRPRFDQTLAAFDYAFPVHDMIHALKYRGELALAASFGCRIAHLAGGGWDLLVPVPIHRERLRERGFNQAVEIARPVARRWRLPLLLDEVERVRATSAQAGLHRRERARNLRGAFRASARLDGRRVLVIDDVMTTGCTLDELAGALKAAGAREVGNLVVARTAAGQA